MAFWDLHQPATALAIVDRHNQSFTYATLQQQIKIIASQFTYPQKSLGFIFCQNDVDSISAYLAALQTRQAVCLLSADLAHEFAQKLVDTYKPDWIWMPNNKPRFTTFQDTLIHNSFVLQKNRGKNSAPCIYPELAVLLSTSGSTGSPKLVRLSYQNLQSNADSISEYLTLNSQERPITTLPMQYSYGLSVINSHLHVGATILLTNETVMMKSFWDFFSQHGATSLAGVPYTYQMLFRLKLHTMNLPTLRTMTQAGGRLDNRLQLHFNTMAKQRQIKFFVMYGQTEATARMSYVPFEQLTENIGSIGIAIPQGRFEIDAASDELLYYGPNVMLGYAASRDDLSLPDMQHGRLATGDLARQDPITGLYYIIGRRKRFLKLVGLRVNLDELEQQLERQCENVCCCIGRDDQLIVLITEEKCAAPIHAFLRETLHLHASLFSIKTVSAIPHLPTGKIDYAELQKRFLS